MDFDLVMKCKKHSYKGGAGVCAPCLRDRLLRLAATHNEASSLPQPLPEPEPVPVPVFPRSVSPYVSRQKSDASGAWRRPSSFLFFRTPQVRPAYGGGGDAGFEEGDIEFEIRRRSSKFSVLSALFGKHRHHGSEERDGGKERKHRSWLAGIIPRILRKKATASAPAPFPPRCSSHVICNRGFSPVSYAHEGGEESSSPAESSWRHSPSPMRQTPCRRRPEGAGASVSGFTVCISPLVRPSPARHHRGGGHPTDGPDFSGELLPSTLHPFSSGTSLHHCRSWKLADSGRFQ
ncbi:hypothetical protein GUJ93_ZPchr0014g47285 [Zizania palustris]|uniref:Uncharacterized protein n=1 Tax=Zizania palustris TaxID=103762 RepID=A0A8J5SXX6_ZIZPA|nr:hypothetical protein GUJ93_ZPchr0014g47285 [Zizania palustris]